VELAPFNDMAVISAFEMTEASDFDTIHGQFSTLAVVQGKEFEKIGEIREVG
jgi:hypothetical protein